MNQNYIDQVNYITAEEFFEYPPDVRKSYLEDLHQQENEFLDIVLKQNDLKTQFIMYQEYIKQKLPGTPDYTYGSCKRYTSFMKYMLSHDLLQNVLKTTRSTKTNYYYYLITFTLKAKFHDGKQWDYIENYIKNRLRAPGLNIMECYFNREYTEAGTAHWHASVRSSKIIKQSRFDNYKKKYGILQVNKTFSNTLDFSKAYCGKDSKYERLI